MEVLHQVEVPTEGVVHQENNTDFYIKFNLIGKGTLYITQSSVVWTLSGTETRGISLSYHDICLHAISRDKNHFPHDSLFLMTQDENLKSYDSESESESDDNDLVPDPDIKSTDVYFVPENHESLNTLFERMSHCQTLNPDPNDAVFSDMEEAEEEDEDEDNENYEDMDDADYQMANMNLNGANNEQFEDADEDVSQ